MEMVRAANRKKDRRKKKSASKERTHYSLAMLVVRIIAIARTRAA
jgi:hypothetical protein